MSDVLVIRTDRRIKPDELRELQANLCYQKATGVVVIPPNWEVLLVPEDVKIKVEGINN